MSFPSNSMTRRDVGNDGTMEFGRPGMETDDDNQLL